MNKDIFNVTDASFAQDVLESDVPVVVEFWAEWCEPCKLTGLNLVEAAGEYAGKIKVAKLDIGDNVSTQNKFDVRGVPTLMLFKKGKVEATSVGAMSKMKIFSFIDSAI
ncbi:Thioredoxin [Moritella sp. JT01]|uniref:thioredoxin n=1 Tax=Moritella sp. JT01 TaxID=756698 RepID=UPI000798B9C2|nr:thioredoxin [Moritella sp. JT01]KXO12663.1 Thioredoxin [Moritella sp. JT01]